MEITEVRVRLVENGPLRAMVTVVFDDCIILRGIKIISRSPQEIYVHIPPQSPPCGFGNPPRLPYPEATQKRLRKCALTAYIELQDSRALAAGNDRTLSGDGGAEPEPAQSEPRSFKEYIVRTLTEEGRRRLFDAERALTLLRLGYVQIGKDGGLYPAVRPPETEKESEMNGGGSGT